VILKKMAFYRDGGSEKHLRDIAGILKVSSDDIDLAYIEDVISAFKIGEADNTAAYKNLSSIMPKESLKEIEATIFQMKKRGKGGWVIAVICLIIITCFGVHGLSGQCPENCDCYDGNYCKKVETKCNIDNAKPCYYDSDCTEGDYCKPNCLNEQGELCDGPCIGGACNPVSTSPRDSLTTQPSPTSQPAPSD
jgi:hypothetical protein